MTSISTKVETGKEFRGIHFLMCMLAFFGVIVTVNVTMAVMASKSWTGLVVKNTYVASQKFNDQLQQAKAQHALGMKSHIGYADGKLRFELFDRNGTRILPENVQIEIGRPAFEQSDQAHTMTFNENGINQLETTLGRGIWAVTITAQTQGTQYRRDARILVGADGTGRLQ